MCFYWLGHENNLIGFWIGLFYCTKSKVSIQLQTSVADS